MTVWQISAALLTIAILPCLYVALRRPRRDALAALELTGTLTTTVLVVLCEAYHRQPFVDLAVVLAVLTNLGALVFARLLEGQW